MNTVSIFFAIDCGSNVHDPLDYLSVLITVRPFYPILFLFFVRSFFLVHLTSFLLSKHILFKFPYLSGIFCFPLKNRISYLAWHGYVSEVCEFIRLFYYFVIYLHVV